MPNETEVSTQKRRTCVGNTHCTAQLGKLNEVKQQVVEVVIYFNVRELFDLNIKNSYKTNEELVNTNF